MNRIDEATDRYRKRQEQTRTYIVTLDYPEAFGPAPETEFLREHVWSLVDRGTGAVVNVYGKETA